MTLALTSLRLAAIAALTNGGNAPFPTAAGVNVYDSREDLATDLDPDQAHPTIAVYTETLSDQDAGNTPGMFRTRQVQMVIAFEYATWLQRDEGLEFAVPETTASLELRLDLMSDQILTALMAPTTWGNLFRGHLRSVESVSVQRYGGSENRHRYAAREMTITLEMGSPCIVGSNITTDLVPPQPSMPDPLATVLQAIADNDETNGTSDLFNLAQELQNDIASVGLPPDTFPVNEFNGYGLTVPFPGPVPDGETTPIHAGGPTDF